MRELRSDPSLETVAWFAGLEGALPARGRHPALRELLARLDTHLVKLTAKAEISEVNGLRREVLSHARGVAAEAPGLFTLTMPTGGGKTLTSLAFALDHAVRHQRACVIYVIPFTSIVEQTASVFREALGGEREDAFGDGQLGRSGHCYHDGSVLRKPLRQPPIPLPQAERWLWPTLLKTKSKPPTGVVTSSTNAEKCCRNGRGI